MSFLNLCFTKNPVKSQPKVGLSQGFFDFEPLDHDLATIPIPSSTATLGELDQISGLDIYDISSFGSFSSAADSLMLDNAILIPSDDPPLSYTTNIQDFYIFGDRDPILLTPSSSLQQDSSLLSSSACDSDFSFCSTPADDILMLSSPNVSPANWLPTGSSPFDLASSTLSNPLFTAASLHPPNLCMDQLFTNLSPFHEHTTIENKIQPSTINDRPTTIKKRSWSRRREYECPYCARKSNRSNNMKEHILTHDPNRPKNFYCTICPKRFARKHDLKRHHQSHERCIEKIMTACGLAP